MCPKAFFLTLIFLQIELFYDYNTEAIPLYNRFIFLLLVYLIGAYIKKYGLEKITSFRQATTMNCKEVMFNTMQTRENSGSNKRFGKQESILYE